MMQMLCMGRVQIWYRENIKLFVALLLAPESVEVYVDSGNLFSGGYPWGGVLEGILAEIGMGLNVIVEI